MTKENKETLQGWLLITPALIFLLTFTHWPILATLFSSIYDPGTAMRPPRFLGMDNYAALAVDPVFRKALVNNLIYALFTVIPSVALSLAMALAVNGNLPFRGALRLSFFTPTILPMVAAANIWLFFYTPEIGLVNRTLALAGIAGPNWLGDSHTALPAMIILAIWKESGFFMIFYLAALQGIPSQYAEAASLEGAGPFHIFRTITFPLLTPTTLFVLINATLNGFKRVDQLFILTKGGPNNATNMLLYYIYESAFSFLDTSYAGALAVILLLILAGLSLINMSAMEKRVHYS